MRRAAVEFAFQFLTLRLGKGSLIPINRNIPHLSNGLIFIPFVWQSQNLRCKNNAEWLCRGGTIYRRKISKRHLQIITYIWLFMAITCYWYERSQYQQKQNFYLFQNTFKCNHLTHNYKFKL